MSGMYSSYHSGNKQEFSQLSDKIGSNIQKISQNVTSMKRMVNQLGSTSNADENRAKLHDIQHYTNQLAQDTAELFQKINTLPAPKDSSEERQRKLQKERLFNEFGPVLNAFQQIQREAAHKEKESIQRARASSHGSRAFMEDGKQLIQLESPVQNQMTMQLDEEVDLDMLRERESQMLQLESDIASVNDIFGKLASIVHDQGEVIDSIEANMESTHIHVSDASQQLTKAREYQNKVRKKKCILIIVLIIILAIVIGIAAYYGSQ